MKSQYALNWQTLSAKSHTKAATSSKMELVQSVSWRTVKRKVDYYNLEVMISVGYRISSLTGIKFRQRATQTLKQHIYVKRNVCWSVLRTFAFGWLLLMYISITFPNNLLPINLWFQFFFTGKVETIFRCKKLLVITEYTIFHNSFIFFSTQNQSNAWIILCWFYEIVKHTHIHIYLSNILMRKFISFEINNEKAFEMKVIKTKSMKKSLDSVWICFWRA